MQKQELKSLVMKYFNLAEITNSPENNEEVKANNFAEATLADGTKIMNNEDREKARKRQREKERKRERERERERDRERKRE